jgi:hypothetical protein
VFVNLSSDEQGYGTITKIDNYTYPYTVKMNNGQEWLCKFEELTLAPEGVEYAPVKPFFFGLTFPVDEPGDKEEDEYFESFDGWDEDDDCTNCSDDFGVICELASGEVINIPAGELVSVALKANDNIEIVGRSQFFLLTPMLYMGIQVNERFLRDERV